MDYLEFEKMVDAVRGKNLWSSDMQVFEKCVSLIRGIWNYKKEFVDLGDSEQEKYIKIAETLIDGEFYYCERVWSAWGYGTMSQDDFKLLCEDDGFMLELAEKIYNIEKRFFNELV